jgi:hypothetical protein
MSGSMRVTVRCPGCDLLSTDNGGERDERFANSAACWAAYGRLSEQTTALTNGAFVHQTAVDAYGVQHCRPGKAITLVFGLVGLYLVVERERTGRQVQLAHMALAKARVPLPDVALGSAISAGTVVAVLDRIPDVGIRTAVTEWGSRVWDAYAPAHDTVRAWATTWPTAATAAIRD